MVRSRIILIAPLFIFAACGNKKDVVQAPPPPIAIDVMVAKPQSFSYTIEANGTVQAQEFVELKPEVSGRIVQMNINEGNAVSAGTLLLKLNDDDFQAQMRKLKSQLEIAKRNEKRLKQLLDANGLNQQEYDVAQNQVTNLEADIDYTSALIRKTELHAPFSGMIGLRNVSMGAIVNNQTVVATLQQIDRLKIDFVLPEDQLNIITKGQEIGIETDKGNKQYKAKIIAIEPQINTGTRNVKVRAQLMDKSEFLSPGAFIKVLISAGKTNSAFMVPTNCIIPDTRNKKIALIKSGKVAFVNVETGYRNEDKAEITKGISLGDTIALNGILFLKPDAPVKIKSVK